MKTVGVIESLKTEDGSQKLDVGCWKTADVCPSVALAEAGWTVDGGRRTADGGRLAVDVLQINQLQINK